MTWRIKIFLLWLLAFAISVQGFAAGVQMDCAPSPSQQVHALAEPAPHGDHDMHMAAMQAHAEYSASDPTAHQHKASSSCSSCPVCTIGAVLPLSLDRLIDLPLAADIPVPTARHGFVGYTPENPERPPSLPA